MSDDRLALSESLGPVLEVVSDLAATFGAAGHRLFLVGGVVRDLVGGSFSEAGDIDLTTTAHPEAIKRMVSPMASALWTQGERFGTIGATIGTKAVEITTHRAESYDPLHRNPEVSFGQTIEEDLSRRDFTINAMAVELPSGELIDPFGGSIDLQMSRLRTPLSPEQSFTDDPLRMMRAARFTARFGLDPADELFDAATKLAGRLSIVSVERVHDELERLLLLSDVEVGLSFLDRTGLLNEIFPGYGVLDEEARAEGLALAASPGSVTVRRAGLMVPLGNGAEAALSRLRYSRTLARATNGLLGGLDLLHRIGRDEAGSGGGLDEGVRRLVEIVGLQAMNDLEQLASHVREWRGDDLGSRTFDRFAHLSATEDLADLGSPLTGQQIMDHLEIEPGREVGAAVKFLCERRLIEGPLTPAVALDRLDSWWATRD